MNPPFKPRVHEIPPTAMWAYCEAVWRRYLMAEKEERRLHPERVAGLDEPRDRRDFSDG